MARKITIEHAIEQIGMGRFQARLLLIFGAVWASVAMEILISAFVIQSMIEERGLTNPQGGVMASAIFAGILFGSWSVGVLTDSFGRKTWLLIMVLADSIFGLMSAFAYGLVLMLILRFATGFALGERWRSIGPTSRNT